MTASRPGARRGSARSAVSACCAGSTPSDRRSSPPRTAADRSPSRRARRRARRDRSARRPSARAPARATCRPRCRAWCRPREELSGDSRRRGVDRAAARGRPHLGEPEVENLRLAALGDEQVRRLQVAMDDAGAVGGIERVGDSARPTRRAGRSAARSSRSRASGLLPFSRSMTGTAGPRACRRRKRRRCADDSSADAARASRLNRSSASAPVAVPSGRNLIATRRPSSRSSAS